MKNLFKNLMLVAVAAMAFTACTETNDEVNAVSKITRYEFTANIADETRSGFAEKEEGATAYKSEWHDGDKVKVFIDSYGTVTTGIDTEGNFALELTDAPEPFFMTVCAPADSWTGKTSWTVPTEQTPLANSVDPKAHMLRSNEGILVANGTPNQKIEMSHFASYGKMTVNGVDFEINKVEVSFNGGQVYTINATNVENNTFWFAISDNLTVSEFTVTAYGEGDAVVTKTVSMEGKEKPLAFSWGRVSTFSVSGLKEYVEPDPEPDPEPSVKTFTSAEVATAYDLNDYEICFKDQDGKEFYVEFYYANGDYVVENNILKEGTYLLDNNGTSNGLYYVEYDGFGYTGATVVVSHVDGLYNIQFTNLWKWDYSAGEETTVPFEEAVYTGAITGLSTPAGTTPDPEPEPEPEPDPEPGVADGTESNPYVYACNVEYQSLFGGYYTLTFTCETEGSFNLYFETMNANLSNFTSSSLSDTSKFYSAQITGYAKSWAAEESTVNITNIGVKTYSVDIKISTFDGYVYYTCPSVVFP